MENKYFGIEPYGATPSERQLNHMKMGKKAFFHFGVNTYSNKEWGDGTELEKIFNPTDLDVRGWIRDVKAAGFELAIITAKHHDGFCLWPSKYTEHTIANSPYKNGNGDLIREFTDACREFNIKAGLYISPWDRNSECWGTDEYSTLYAKQLEELACEYGEIDEIWWDGAGSFETRYDWELWASIVRKNQPNAVIFGSMGAAPYVDIRWVGNEAGYAGKTHYASIDESSLLCENVSELNTGKIGGERYIPAEVDVSIRPGWFYHEDQDDKVKLSRTIDRIWFRSVGNNAMMLLNFPPDRSGRLGRVDVNNAIESNDRIKRMLDLNLLDGADVSADSCYTPECAVSNALSLDDESFYASAPERDSAVINITLTEDVPASNLLILGEKVELGERITSFVLESLDGEEVEILCTGTSVGYQRAVLFESRRHRRLRLTLIGVAAPLTLRRLFVGAYDQEKEDAKQMKRRNLAILSSAQIVMAEDRKSFQVNFGGIYSFDTISFSVDHIGGEYVIFAFDGSKFYKIASGNVEENIVCVCLDEPVDSSYQIRVEYSKLISMDPDIRIL